MHRTIGMRVPDNQIVHAMLAALGEPIMSSTLMLPGDQMPLTDAAEIEERIGNQIELIVDGGVRRGTHVLKALAAGATACSGGRMYLYALAGAGGLGVTRAMTLIRDEIMRDMRLMGCANVRELAPSMLAFRDS
jgi:L-lactate dehydrogenase (cytochrome)